jgi:hypothetical protein
MEGGRKRMVNRGEKAKQLDPKPKPPAEAEAPEPEEKPQTDLDVAEEFQELSDEEFMKGYEDITVDDVIVNGYVEKKVDLTKNFSFKVRTLKKKEELDLKRRISDYDGVQMYVLDEINVDTLAFAVTEINGTPMAELPSDPDKRKEAIDKRKDVIGELSEAVTLSMIEEFRKLNKALVILLKGSSKNFLARRLLGQGLV